MNPRTIQAVGLAICAIFIGLSGTLTRSINAGRESLSMISQVNPLESAPPEYAFAVQAFGAFRGLLTNIAFIRAEQYKSEGKFYDAMQLASWITKLQPRFIAVWEFMSWNMSWNISVTTYTPEERWNWVYNGAKLLRDEGLRYNPRAVNMYRQLSWIFGNKMSESVDEYHLSYKRNWAWRMHLLLGPPPDPLGEYRPDEPFKAVEDAIGGKTDKLAEVMLREGKRRYETKKAQELARKGITGPIVIDLDAADAPAIQKLDDVPRMEGFAISQKAVYDELEKIASAPATLPALYEKMPAAREMVARLLAEMSVRFSDETLTEEAYWETGGPAFSFFYPYRLLTDPPSLVRQIVIEDKPDPRKDAAVKLDEILGVKKKDPVGEALVRWFQKKVLREVYKLDPDKMAHIVAIFGPIDWRGVDGHALYWLNEGLIAGDETISKFGNDKTNTTRQIFFSLRNLFYRNRIAFEPYTENVAQAYINFNPDMNFIEPMHKAYLAYGAVLEVDPQYQEGAGDAFRSGHINFLSESVRLLYFAGREREAEYYLDYLRNNYAIRKDGSSTPEFLKPLPEFVIDSWGETMTYNQVYAAIGQYLLSGFLNLADGDIARYSGNRIQAEKLHDSWHKDTSGNKKLAFPPIDEMEIDGLIQLYLAPPATRGDSLKKVSLWRYLPKWKRQALWDSIAGNMQTECKAAKFDFAKAFPEPVGMEEYRKTHPARVKPEKKDEVETLPMVQ